MTTTISARSIQNENTKSTSAAINVSSSAAYFPLNHSGVKSTVSGIKYLPLFVGIHVEQLAVFHNRRCDLSVN